MKRLPYEKTVVLELRTKLADLLTQTVALKGTVAVPIPTSDPYNSGDAIVTDANQLLIRAKNVVVISSMEDFVVSISGVNESIDLLCRGMFLHSGAANVYVKPSPTSVTQQARIQYIWS